MLDHKTFDLKRHGWKGIFHHLCIYIFYEIFIFSKFITHFLYHKTYILQWNHVLCKILNASKARLLSISFKGISNISTCQFSSLLTYHIEPESSINLYLDPPLGIMSPKNFALYYLKEFLFSKTYIYKYMFKRFHFIFRVSFVIKKILLSFA